MSRRVMRAFLIVGLIAGSAVLATDTAAGSTPTTPAQASGSHNRFNHAPDMPTQLAINGQPCTGTPLFPGNGNPTISARLTAPDGGESVSGHFVVWPVDPPSRHTEFTSLPVANGTVATVSLTDAVLADGRTYAWAVQAENGKETSPWSSPCEYTVDRSSPDVEPTVTSLDYPDDGTWHLGAGIPGSFTFTAAGVSDVAGFYYGTVDPPSTYVAADRLGGSATISYTPQDSGPQDLYVVSVDRAGHRSPKHVHHFYVQNTGPGIQLPYVIELGYPGEVSVGVPAVFTFSPGLPDVVSYTYQLNNGPEITVPATADGTATASIVAPSRGTNFLTAWNTTSTGMKSGANQRSFRATDKPLVSSDVYPEYGDGGGPGVPGTFTLVSGLPNLASFVCYFDYFDGPVEVAAGPDGRATLNYIPNDSGLHILEVYVQNSDGSRSVETREYDFNVNPAS